MADRHVCQPRMGRRICNTERPVIATRVFLQRRMNTAMEIGCAKKTAKSGRTSAALQVN